MAIVDYVSFDEVRAALGVSSDEIKDTTLSLELFDFNLVSELEDIGANLIADYATQKLTAPTSWSAVQTRLHQSLRLFSAYAVAKQCTIALPMFAPKEDTDGKATVVRFAQDPYKATTARVLAQYDAFKAKLETAYAAVLSTTAPALTARPYLSVVSPSFDPVTGA